MKKGKIHIGKLIKSKLKEDGHSVVWLARRLECNRNKMYRIFENYYIDTEMLIKISTVLHYDFFAHYSVFLIENEAIN